MICDVIISKTNNKFIARAKDWPEIAVKENSRDKAINSIKSRLINYLNHKIELVKIEVPLESKTGNPWVDKFGWFKEDPTFDDLENEIASYRKEIDREMEYSAK
ncbi:MAG TPA: hypothetical protein VK469_04005 [Candidatus Kapabacteria bacterium]|nr:hypothetical protein [Candidatus Kapabacteria bacterium]